MDAMESRNSRGTRLGNGEESDLGRGILDIVIEGEMTQRQIDSISMHFVIDFRAINSIESELKGWSSIYRQVRWMSKGDIERVYK